jgi:hypothetical protein
MDFNKLSTSAMFAVQNNFAGVPTYPNGMIGALVSVNKNVDNELLSLGAISSPKGNQGSAVFTISFLPSNLAQIQAIDGVTSIDFGAPSVNTLGGIGTLDMPNSMQTPFMQTPSPINQIRSATGNTGNWLSNNKGLVVILGVVAVLGFMKYKKMI